MTLSADPLVAGREAMERHAWEDAYGILHEADRSGLLSGEGLQILAQAAWWSGRPEETIQTGERAYEAFIKEGNTSAAAMAAFQMARQHAMRMAGAAAGGWFAKAERLVADDPDAPVCGYLAWMRGFMAQVMEGDSEKALALFDEALEIARRTGDRNVAGMSLMDKGWALCNQGRYAEGLALSDEAMVTAVGGEMDPIATGYVYCSMIGMCSHRGDYRRAAEWTEATTRWCERYSITGFPGVCRVHKAEIMRRRGSWLDAEQEARHATEELPKFNFLGGLGFAFYEIGEVRRRQGDFAAAEEAYRRAHEFGKDPEPGLSLVRLGQGQFAAAAAGVRRALAQNQDGLSRAQPLLAQAEIALVTRDLDVALAASRELDSTAEEIGTQALLAQAAGVRGAVRLAQGDPEGALGDLRSALRAWQEMDAPYETAEVRVLLGNAYRAMGDNEGALLELRAAHEIFERLGASWALGQVAELLGEIATSTVVPNRVRRAFVFTDIVKSTDLVQAIGDEAWEDLLSWHDQTLRSVFASNGGEVAHHTGDGFFVSFATAEAAIAGAVAVQRALAQHRRQTGFAPVVRIGVHIAEATRRGKDFGGGEVHKAARIAAQAVGWEILASEDALAEAGGKWIATDTRELELKGFSEPVRVARVEWR